MSGITFTQIAYLSMRDLGVLRPAQVGSPDVLTDMLAACNYMLDSYKLNRFLVLDQSVATYALTANTQSFTIGAGATLDGPRPTSIEKANVIVTLGGNLVRQQLELIDFKRWSEINLQQVTPSLPQKLYYQKTITGAGYGTIFIWPQADVAYGLELYTWDQSSWSGFTDLTTAYVFPPGFAEMIQKNLAVRTYPMLRVYLKIPMEPLAFGELKSLGEQLRIQMQQYNAPETTIAPDRTEPAGQMIEADREAPQVRQ
jgi:hypothetical protein